MLGRFKFELKKRLDLRRGFLLKEAGVAECGCAPQRWAIQGVKPVASLRRPALRTREIARVLVRLDHGCQPHRKRESRHHFVVAVWSARAEREQPSLKTRRDAGIAPI